MKKSIRLTVSCLGLLVVCPLAAGEVGLFYDRLTGSQQSIGSRGYEVKPLTGYGLRGGMTLIDLKMMELGVTASYHAKAESDCLINNERRGTFSMDYWALGVQADWKLLVNLHAAVEARRESLGCTWDGGGKADATWVRPWIRAGVGFALPLPAVTPFVRLEGAFAVTKENGTVNPDDAQAFCKAMAPHVQMGLCAGVKF